MPLSNDAHRRTKASRIAAFVIRLAAFAFFIWVVLLLTLPVAAEDTPATANLSRAGHYCISCHSANDARLTDALAWNGSITRDADSPCPTVKQMRQEIAYADEAFDAIANVRAEIASRGMATDALDKRVLGYAESFPRLLETPYRSADAGVNDARAFRYQLNKAYMQAQADRSAWNANVILVIGILATLFILGSLAWGYLNTRTTKTVGASGRRIGPWSVVLVLIVFGVFALPIFNPPAQSELATEADLERLTALDNATRAAVGAENTSAQAWQLARLAAATAPHDVRLSSLALFAALSATQELETNAAAYWGRARALEESAATWEKSPDAAPPSVHRLEVAAASAWAYAAMADEIARTDAPRARALLDAAHARALKNPDPYFRATDLKVIAVAWGRVDKTQAQNVANQIADPFMRAWALRELGQFEQAAATARQIDDANRRAFALREIARASKNANLLGEALLTAQALSEPARAYALADLAAAWAAFDANEAVQVANAIAPPFADARASAFRHSGRYADAWRETEKLAGNEQARAQSELVAAWARVAPNDALIAAQKIRVPFWQAHAQRAVVAALASSDAARALDLARAIPLPSARVRALTDVARVTRDAATFRQAAQLADALRDPYPLRDLAIAWAPVEPTSALALVDKIEREAERAPALLAVALALAPTDRAQANAVFDRALRQAQAARLRGDPFYSAELLREFGVRYAAIDAAKAAAAFDAARDSADKVTTGF